MEPREAMDDGLVVLQREDGEAFVVVTRPFASDTVIRRFSAEETLSSPTWLTVQTGSDEHIQLSPSHLRRINHSCEPNVFFDTDELAIIALREIAVGDELTFFYPSTEWDMAQPFVCGCGTKSCLGTIRGARHLEPHQLDGIKLNSHVKRLLVAPVNS
jgi:hypothetical protein